MNDKHRQILDAARDVVRLAASVEAGEKAMAEHAQELERCQLRLAEDTSHGPAARALLIEAAQAGEIHMGAIRALAHLEHSVNHWQHAIDKSDVAARADRDHLDTRRREYAAALERFTAACDSHE